MCGVYGIVDWTSDRPEFNQTGKSYAQSLAHRGPDSQNEKTIDEFCILGNTRLAIVDVQGFNQPLTCNCGDHHLSFNGEIYNSAELREELDYEFNTAGDSETLLALLCKLGINRLNLLRGQFAFSLWNSQTKTLALATDFFGIVPMYVYMNNERIIFCSSAKAIAEEENLDLDLNYCKKALYSKFNLSSYTGYQGVQKIPPGSTWEFSSAGVKRIKWHKFLSSSSNKENKDSELLRLLEQAADRVSISEKKIGVFLSSGIDSAIVSTLLQKRLSYQLPAYTAFFDQNLAESELPFAKKIAMQLDLDFKPVLITETQWWENLFEASKLSPGPLIEPADVAMFSLAAEAKKDVSVIVTGEGADELFGGYKKYAIEQFARYRIFQLLSTATLRLTRCTLNPKYERVIRSTSKADKIERWASYFDVHHVDIPSLSFKDFNELGQTESQQIWDIENYLTLLLERADSMCMAHSIESRPMFLDLDLAEFALSMKKRDFIGLLHTKPLLRRVSSSFLTPETINRPKRGFPIPVAKWFQYSLNERISEYLLDSKLAIHSVYAKDQIAKSLRLEKSKGHLNHENIFRLLSIAVWMEQNKL